MQQRPRHSHGTTTMFSWPRVGRGPVAIGLFFGFFLYVWLRSEPVVEYQAAGPFFYDSYSFFKPYPRHLGGGVEYGAMFLTQLDAYNWLGALVFTALGGAMFFSSGFLLRRLTGANPGLIPAVPLFLLLICRNLCGNTCLILVLGWLMALGGVAAYLLVSSRSLWVRLVVGGSLLALVAYLAGLWACALLAVLCCLHEAMDRKAYFSAFGMALASSIVLAVGILLPEAQAAKLLNPVGNSKGTWAAAALYLFLPAVALLLWLISRTPASPALTGNYRKGASSVPRRGWFQTRGAQGVLASVLLVVGCAMVGATFDPQRQASAEIDYYVRSKQYDQVLSVARQMKQMDFATEVRVHLALYHTGRLAEDLFAFPNRLGAEPLPGITGGLNSCRPQSQTLLELGLVCDAEHLAHEAWEWEGDRPDLLASLALINLLKDRPGAARMFLKVLRQRPVQPCWLGSAWQDHVTNSDPKSIPEYAEIRSRMLPKDVPHQGQPGEGLLSSLLTANPTNRMAFEYLMAHYLLTLDLKKAVERLPDLDRFEYAGIPRSYEEALLLYEQMSGNRVELKGRQIRPETALRFKRYVEAVNRGGFEDADKREALAQEYGDTYWFYFFSTQALAQPNPSKSAGS